MVMDTAMKDYVKKYKVPVKDIAMICDLYYCCTVITAIPSDSAPSLDAIDQKWIDQNLPADQADKFIKDESIVDQSHGPSRTFLFVPAKPDPNHTFCRLDGFLVTSEMLYHVRVNKVIPMQPSRSQHLASRQINDMKYAINKVNKTFEVIRKHLILHGNPAKD